MKKGLLIFSVILILIISVIIDWMTYFRLVFDQKITMLCDEMDNHIIADIKEHFNIDYDFNKVTFYVGIPDGYYLILYDTNNETHNFFEDAHEGSQIFHYFNGREPDLSKYMFLLIGECIFEIAIISFLIFKIIKYDKIKKKDISLL